MKVEDLAELVAANPEKEVKKGTSRFCYRDGSLWVKTESNELCPILTWRGDFFIRYDWPCGLSDRTRANLDTLKGDVERGWSNRLRLEAGSGPSILIDYDRAPNSDSSNKTYLTKPVMDEYVAYRNSSSEQSVSLVLENAIRELAYQTIVRENTLVELIKRMREGYHNISALAQRFGKVTEELVATHCAPHSDFDIPDDAIYPHSGGHLVNSLKHSEDLSKAVSSLQTLCQSFNRVATSQTARGWKINGENGINSNGLDRHIGNGYNTDPFYSNDEWCHTGFRLSFGGHIVFRDLQVQSASFYYIQEHIHHYLNAFRDIGFPCSMPFGVQPEAWDYMEIAAPLFVERGDH